MKIERYWEMDIPPLYPDEVDETPFVEAERAKRCHKRVRGRKTKKETRLRKNMLARKRRQEQKVEAAEAARREAEIEEFRVRVREALGLAA